MRCAQLLVAVTCLAAALAAPSRAAVPTFTTVPALPVAGADLTIHLDLSPLGRQFCHLSNDSLLGLPELVVDASGIELFFWGDALPQAPTACDPGATSRLLTYSIPGSKMKSGYSTITLFERLDGSGKTVWTARAGVSVAPVVAEATLQGGRIQVRVAYHDPQRTEPLTANAVMLSSESAAFWFFHPDNPEVEVKVLDGGAINGHYWLFAGSLTTLPFELTVFRLDDGCSPDAPADGPSCPSRAYRAPGGSAVNFTDTSALPTGGR